MVASAPRFPSRRSFTTSSKRSIGKRLKIGLGPYLESPHELRLRRAVPRVNNAGAGVGHIPRILLFIRDQYQRRPSGGSSRCMQAWGDHGNDLSSGSRGRAVLTRDSWQIVAGNYLTDYPDYPEKSPISGIYGVKFARGSSAHNQQTP